MWHTDLKHILYDLIPEQMLLVKEKRMYKMCVNDRKHWT